MNWFEISKIEYEYKALEHDVRSLCGKVFLSADDSEQLKNMWLKLHIWDCYQSNESTKNKSLGRNDTDD